MKVHFAPDRCWTRLLAFVVAVAVAACHGLLGASHVAGGPLFAIGGAAADSKAVDDSADNHREMGHGEAASHHHGGTASEYFAVLLAVLLASILSLLRLSKPPRRSCKNTSLLRRTRLRKVIANLPRGPTLSAIQVFRL